MARKFGTFDILRMAEQIEQNGIDFYRMAAARFQDDALHDLFTQLAAWEARHKEALGQMKRDMLEQMDMKFRFDEASYVTSDPRQLHSLADNAIKGDPQDQLSKIESKLDILGLALKREADAIKFFRALVGHLRDLPAKKKIRAIIEEEKKHINILTQSVQSLENRRT